MVDIRPFRGLRYDPARVAPDEVIAPPYDVVSAADIERLLARSPANIAHVESCPGEEETRYTRAAAALRQWQADGLLLRDSTPAYYAYEQRSAIAGAHGAERITRRSFFARLRVSPPAAGEVRPHEATLSGPKRERLALQRATRANVSPIFAMFSDPAGTVGSRLAVIAETPAAFTAVDVLGDEHRLWPITGAADIEALTGAVAASSATIADGHHRFATALEYLRERGGDTLPADAPERWVLAGLVPQQEAGLVVLPIHRLIHDSALPGEFASRLGELYAIKDRSSAGWSRAGARALWDEVASSAGTPGAFGLIGLGGQTLHLLRPRSAAAIDAEMPAELSAASRTLDVLVLRETVLQPLLGIDQAALAAGERVTFTESVDEAWEAVNGGECRIAFLVNPTRVEQIVAVADAGELMPQKSTYFYPKLATGMVINLLDE